MNLRVKEINEVMLILVNLHNYSWYDININMKWYMLYYTRFQAVLVIVTKYRTYMGIKKNLR